MGIRVKIRIIVGEKSVITSALVNSGFEAKNQISAYLSV